MSYYAEETDEREHNEHYQLVDNGSQSTETNNHSMNVIGFDIDSMMEVINSQKEYGLDDVTTQLMTMNANNLGNLKKIQQHSVQLKTSIDSSKYHVKELEELKNEEQEKAESRQNEMHAKRLELEELKSKNVDDINNFENDVHQISVYFTEGPEKYDSKTLNQSVEQLQKVLSDNISDLNQYKEEMIKENEKYKQITVDDSLISLHKTFDESITDIDTLNKKLKSEVDQLLTEVNRARLKFDLLTKFNNN